MVGDSGTVQSDNFSKIALAVVAATTVLLLLPFINKAFHIDDTLFLWSAKHIHSQPFDFYGFIANWNGVERPMYEINQNPPLVAYYIALAAYFFGWTETALHLAFIIPAVCLSVGVYFLAILFCRMAFAAALIAVATPAFLVSSTNVMSDILMVALYVWGAVFWLYGLEKNKMMYLCISGILIGLSALSKYFGISMVPLLLVYTLMKNRRLDRRLIFLIIPVAVLFGYQWLTLTLYDTSLFSNAAAYALERGVADSPDKFIIKTLVGLSFCGGCMAIVLFYSHMFWSRLQLISGASVAVLLTAGILLMDMFSEVPGINWLESPVLAVMQLFVFVFIGMQILFLAIADAYKNRDSKSVFLLLWVLGTFVFSSHVNWTINARTLLPMIPAVGILAVRRLSVRFEGFLRKNYQRLLWPLVPGAVIALAVSWGDASFAGCQREMAQYFYSGLKDYKYPVWFQGHWGFQYYMQQQHFKSLDYKNSLVGTGDIVIIPKTNTGQLRLPLDKFTFAKKLECEPLKWAGTTSSKNKAGFYSDTRAKLFLPFVFAEIEAEEYYVFLVGKFKEPEKSIRQMNGNL